MKIKLNGIATRDEIITAIDNTLEFLGVDFDKQCLNGVNIYFNVYEINGDIIEFSDETGNLLESLTFPTAAKEKRKKRITLKKEKS